MLIDNLRLMDGHFLKRAAVLLFHPDPEKYVTGAYIKIGFFKTDDDLLFQDTIHGNLFEQVEKSMELLLSKYLKASIKYEGLSRIEEYPFPEPALREALLNAVAHKDYSSGNPIQISVYDNKIIFWNSGHLPENWTLKNIIHKHSSEPFNPQISNAFFRAGLIEAWGRGTIKIINECKKHKIPAPIFKFEPTGFWLEMKTGDRKNDTRNDTRKIPETGSLILQLIKQNSTITTQEIGEKIGKTKITVLRQIEKLKADGLIKRVGHTKGGHWEILKDKK